MLLIQVEFWIRVFAGLIVFAIALLLSWFKICPIRKIKDKVKKK